MAILPDNEKQKKRRQKSLPADRCENRNLTGDKMSRSSRFAAVGTLASGVAHEINNPLTAILGFSSALLGRVRNNEPIDPEELSEYLEVINKEALRCKEIVEKLSRFTRQSEISWSEINVLKFLENVLNLMRVRMVSAEISAVVEVDADIAVYSDAGRLEQVFVNIITNCIDFCPRGSKLTIKNVPSREPDLYCRIEINDNGPGIKPEVLSKVFDPFFTTKGVGHGSGMGLALCYKLIDECNGHIDISSRPGGGTTVIIDLPAAGVGFPEKDDSQLSGSLGQHEYPMEAP